MFVGGSADLPILEETAAGTLVAVAGSRSSDGSVVVCRLTSAGAQTVVTIPRAPHLVAADRYVRKLGKVTQADGSERLYITTTEAWSGVGMVVGIYYSDDDGITWAPLPGWDVAVPWAGYPALTSGGVAAWSPLRTPNDVVLTGRVSAGGKPEVLGVVTVDENSLGHIVRYDGTSWTTLFTMDEIGQFCSIHKLGADAGYLVSGCTSANVRFAYYCTP